MNPTSRDVLRRLGAGETIESVCRESEWSRTEFDAWWRREAASRAPCCDGEVPAAVRAGVTIERDRWGVPHVLAERRNDLWFGFGYAMAQDRLFQMDYLRRKGLGRLAEVLGPTALPLDVVARTVGLNRIARDELARLPGETREFLDAFSEGVNAWVGQCGDRLPVEFDLLDYRPEPWSPVDSLAVEGEFRWYLTGRFPVIVMPELAKRVLGDGPLCREFLLGEADEEAVVPPGAYADLRRDPKARPHETVGQVTGDPEGTGSNNWVIAGRHCASGRPMVASDPHIAFEAVSCWYEVHLRGDGFHVAGVAYVGMPAVMFGRNERVAWGITNNLSSLRDLYQERTDPAHPGCFAFDGRWEPARETVEVIRVKGADPLPITVRFSRNGPIVDEILPPPGPQTGPVALKWLGADHGGWLSALLAMDRAGTVAEFREAVRPWHVPSFNLIVADVDGRIAVQCAGRVPIRRTPERGYRPGWDPDHQWLGLIPFEAMPHAIDPERGWLASANNRVAGDDYPYPLHGTWTSGYRAVRIRQMIEAKLAAFASIEDGPSPRGFAFDDFRAMQHDTVSLRAVTCLPPLLAALSGEADQRVRAAVTYLQGWDGRVEAELVAPLLFNAFFTRWARAVAEARFDGPTAELLARQAEGVASRLLSDDPHGWFPPGRRVPTLRRVFNETLDDLTRRLGPNIEDWQWGRLHRLPLKHVLASHGDIGQLLDHGGGPVKGDLTTVCNTGNGLDWLATTGATCRLIADLGADGLWAVDSQSQSGNPGTTHYSDRFDTWSAGEYDYLPLDRAEASRNAVERLVLRPSSSTMTDDRRPMTDD
jgi:penicillin amidase